MFQCKSCQYLTDSRGAFYKHRQNKHREQLRPYFKYNSSSSSSSVNDNIALTNIQSIETTCDQMSFTNNNQQITRINDDLLNAKIKQEHSEMKQEIIKLTQSLNDLKKNLLKSTGSNPTILLEDILDQLHEITNSQDGFLVKLIAKKLVNYSEKKIALVISDYNRNIFKIMRQDGLTKNVDKTFLVQFFSKIFGSHILNPDNFIHELKKQLNIIKSDYETSKIIVPQISSIKINNDLTQFDLNESSDALKPYWIYMIKEREFVNAKQNVYKVGVTTDLKQRMSCYPKQSEIFYSEIVRYNCEKMILQSLKKKFKQRKDIGSEYFEGCQFEIIRVIKDEISSLESNKNVSNDI